jgi:hypothetical protein
MHAAQMQRRAGPCSAVQRRATHACMLLHGRTRESMQRHSGAPCSAIDAAMCPAKGCSNSAAVHAYEPAAAQHDHAPVACLT